MLRQKDFHEITCTILIELKWIGNQCLEKLFHHSMNQAGPRFEVCKEVITVTVCGNTVGIQSFTMLAIEKC